MTTKYVWMNGDNSTGNSKATAYTTIDGARSAASLGSNDIILVHTGTTPHLETGAAPIDITGPSSGAPLTIIGVDMDDSDSYLVASTDILVTTGVNDIIFDGGFAVYGIWCNSGDDINILSDRDESFFAKDCKFTLPGTTGEDLIVSMFSAFKDCTFDLGALGVILFSGKKLTLINPTLIGTRSDGIIDAGNAQGIVHIIGGDFTSLAVKVVDVSGSYSEACIIGCVQHATAALTNQTLSIIKTNISGTDTVAGNNQWREELSWGPAVGGISLSDTVYRDGTAGYDGTNEYSFLYEPGSVQHIDAPTYTDWNSKYVASGDGQNIKVYIAATASQDDAEVWVEVEYFSAVANTLKIVASSRIANILVTPAANATSTGEAWTGITEVPANGQYLTLPANIDIKKSGMLRWRVGFASADDVYLDMEPDII